MELLIIRKHFERVSNLFLIVFLLLFLLFSSVGSASASWSIETIDNANPIFNENTSAKISLSADANGKIHVSYIDYIDATHNSLRYANNVSGSWTISTVRSGSVYADGVSMAIDSIGKVHICSIEINQSDGNLRDLRYTTNSSGAWVSTIIDTGHSSDPGIAVDSNNKIHISYLDWASHDYLKYATNVSGSWQISTIVDGHTSGMAPFGVSAIAVDKNSKAHICFYDVNNPGWFRYITNVSGDWVVTFSESFEGAGVGGDQQISIAVDQNNFVHTVYYNTQYDAVKYATNAYGFWITTTVSDISVDSFVRAMSLALDNGGRVHICYYGWIQLSLTTALKYVTNKQGTWQTQTVESDESELHSSIAISPDQRVHIGYYFSNVNSSVVKHAYYNDSAPTVTTGSATNVTPISATLNGTVNPNGLLTNYYFQWGTTTTYGHTTTSQSAGGGTGTVPVSANLTGLTPNTNYHYQLKATNSAGTNYGADMTFKTKSAMPWLMLLLGD